MEQALIFKLDGCEYAIDSEALIKIERSPELTPVSYAPKSVRGLCSTEGQIIPVFDTLHLLTSQSQIDTQNPETRALIIRDGERVVSLLIEEVIHNIAVSTEDIEYIDNSEDAVIGFMKYKESVVQILGIEKLISVVEMTQLQRKEKKQEVKGKLKEDHQASHMAKQYLVFNMEDEKFGIMIDVVREIIVDQEQMISIANSPEEVLGLITLRQEVIPVVDLRVHFSKSAIRSEKNRILIVHVENALVGVLVDSIDDIAEISEVDVEELTAKYKDEKVSGIAKQNEKLTTILSNNYLKVVASKVQAYLQNKKHDNEESVLKRDYENFDEVVIFALSDEEFALDVEDIIEIVRYESLTEVPASKEYILGMINLRGEVIPVVSLMHKLGLQESQKENGNILISKIAGSKVGFFVESVSDIVNIPLNQIIQNSDKNNIFSHTILLDSGERMILKMATENLFLKEELTLDVEEMV